MTNHVLFIFACCVLLILHVFFCGLHFFKNYLFKNICDLEHIVIIRYIYLMDAPSMQVKYLLPCCCICYSLSFDTLHDHVLKKLNFDLSNPPLGQEEGDGCGQNICYHVAAFLIPFNLTCNMTMLWYRYIHVNAIW